MSKNPLTMSTVDFLSWRGDLVSRTAAAVADQADYSSVRVGMDGWVDGFVDRLALEFGPVAKAIDPFILAREFDDLQAEFAHVTKRDLSFDADQGRDAAREFLLAWGPNALVNAATEAVALSRNTGLTWVNNGDDHRELHTLTVTAGDTFTAGGMSNSFPGRPASTGVGDSDPGWGVCTCALALAPAPTASQTFAAETPTETPVTPEESTESRAGVGNDSDPDENSDSTAGIIVLLPAEDDPVRSLASGKHPHTTLVYLGDDTTDWDAVAGLVERAAGVFDVDPVDHVAGEGELGDNNADVLLLDAAFSQHLRDWIVTEEGIEAEIWKAEQFPHWTPHLAIGYPDAPAVDQARPEQVTYDRLALWVNGTMAEYPLTRDTPDSVIASAEVDEDEDALLKELAEEAEEGGQVPWHGVLAPEGVRSADGRMFAKDSLRTRTLPIPLAWTPASWGKHDGSVIVGRIDRVWRDSGGRVCAEGVFDSSENGYEAVRMIAEDMLRGVSVDVTDVTAQMDEKAQLAIMEDAVISAATLVPIPAFPQAYVSLGPWGQDHGDDQPQEEPAAEFAISEDSWSGSPSRFTNEEYHRSCIIHLHEGGTPESKDDCKLPIREPNGDLSRAGVHAAAARINQTEAPDEQISKAKASLRSAYKELSEDPPEEITPSGSDTETFDVPPPKTIDGPGWITHPKPTHRITSYWVDGRGAAKIGWGAPGDFNRCRAKLGKYVQNPAWLSGLCANLHYRALGVWPGQHSMSDSEALSAITASAAPSARLVDDAPATLSADWFTDPGLDGPTALSVTDEGRVYGHLATWGTCHIGFDQVCTTAPSSQSGYAYFHTGVIDTDAGQVPVGQIVMGGPHANPRARMRAAFVHYASTSSALADVAVGEDAHGIWVAGAIRPDAPAGAVRELRASALSGDWREVRSPSGSNLELVAALAVNVPGFPIPRATVSEHAGEQVSLVAAGTVMQTTAQRAADVKANWRATHLSSLRSAANSLEVN